jgi:hydrogenase-4 component B
MLCHAALALWFGLAPALGIELVRPALEQFPVGTQVGQALAPVGSLVWASRGLALVLLLVGGMRWWQGRAARRSVTWGCGYTAVSPRMQYTGSSFSEQMARIFDAFTPALRRERMPSELFPQQPGQLATHHADAVEQRIFEVLGRAEEFVTRASQRIPAHPRFAFAAGLLALLIIGALALGGRP